MEGGCCLRGVIFLAGFGCGHRGHKLFKPACGNETAS